jgi:hypothetical protein
MPEMLSCFNVRGEGDRDVRVYCDTKVRNAIEGLAWRMWHTRGTGTPVLGCEKSKNTTL